MPFPALGDENYIRILLAILGLCVILYFLPILYTEPEPVPLPENIHAQGYFTHSPQLGIVRVIPICGPRVQSPVSTSTAPRDVGTEENPAPY